MNKRLRATSLVEVLIVLAIISSTILGSMVLVSNSFVVVRQNQTEDYVNGLVINAMEIVKSPSNVLVTDDSFAAPGATAAAFFKLSKSSSGSSFFLERIQDQQITSCETGSAYQIKADTFKVTQAGATAPLPTETTDNSIPLPAVCIQVKIIRIASLGGSTSLQDYFQLTVIAIYNLDNQPTTITFQSNRYESFKKT